MINLLYGVLLSSALNCQGQTLTFSTNLTSIIANSTRKTDVYCLHESTNLIDWGEVSFQRGTDTNLVFDVNKNASQKFFRTISTYEPVTPTNFPHLFYRRDVGLGTVSFDEQVCNYSSNIDIKINWVETYNPTMASYSVNMPFSQTLTNGVNYIHTTFSDINLGTGQRLEGNVHLEVQQ